MHDFFKNKKVVVTGGSGFLGSHFILQLLERGAIVKTNTHKSKMQVFDDRIEVIENIDLTDLAVCRKFIENSDYVIHCAGKIAHPSTVPTDVQISIEQTRLVGTIAEACSKEGVKKFLDLNSSTGYPDIRRPLNEDEYWIDEPYKSCLLYTSPSPRDRQKSRMPSSA